MCRFRSGVVVYDASTGSVRLYILPGEDSHEKIREKFKIRDDDGVGAMRQTPVEFIPVESWTDFDKWKLVFDADRPAWWTDEHTAEIRRQFIADVCPFAEGNWPKWSGDLDLRSLTTLPKGFAPKVGGDLDLSSLTTLPKGFAPKVGGNLYLSSLTTLPKGFAPKVGGNLYLSSLTTLPKGFAPKVGGDLYLRSVMTLPKGFAPKVGGNLYLSSVTTLPKGFAFPKNFKGKIWNGNNWKSPREFLAALKDK